MAKILCFRKEMPLIENKKRAQTDALRPLKKLLTDYFKTEGSKV